MATGGAERRGKPEDSTPSARKNIQKSLGIFCWGRNADIISLALELQIINGAGNVISVSDEKDWSDVGGFSPVIIICPSPRSAAPGASPLGFLEFCSTRADTTLIITDMEDAEYEKSKFTVWKNSGIPGRRLITLSESEMDVINTADREPETTGRRRRMARKINHMRDMIQSGRGNSRNLLQRLERGTSRAVIGVFSRDCEGHYSWLLDTLRSQVFTDQLVNVRPCHIRNNGRQQFLEDVTNCEIAILYHTQNRGRINVTNVEGSLYDEELQRLSSILGWNKVFVLIDDLSDSSDKKKSQILKYQPSIEKLAADLILISPEEKTSDYQRHLLRDRGQLRRKLRTLMEIMKNTETSHGSRKSSWWSGLNGKDEKTEEFQSVRMSPVPTRYNETSSGWRRSSWWSGPDEKGEKTEELQSARLSPVTTGYNGEASRRSQEGGERSGGLSVWERLMKITSVEFPPLNQPRKKSVGIFSRSSEKEYSWLKMLLESEAFSDQVRAVRSCGVSNNSSGFYQNVTLCDFGILYHTKKQGRINVTNVTDSMYDEELQRLSSMLGKQNVVVVIDDLEDTSDTMKEKLLSAQHSIRLLAQDLILVRCSSSKEKMKATKDAFTNVLH